MDDSHSASGSFWVLAPEDGSGEPDASGAEGSPRLSFVVENWLAVIVIAAMIGLSDVLMFVSWR